jgi:predicted AlkP superfamily phosphohydrolase/phosphomutase
LYPDPGQAYSDSGIDAFLKRLYKAADSRMEAFDYLLKRDPWDFAMMVFNGTDTVSHAMWKFMDENHPLHDPARRHKYGNAIRDYYAYVDEKLGKFLADVADDTTVMLMSDHGFGPFHKFIHVNNWLIQEGLMKINDKPLSRIKHALFRSGFAPMNIYNTLMSLGLGALKREVVRGQGQGLMKTLFLSFEDVDWSRTAAYSLGNVGQIKLNVVGREPNGYVQPGEQYERVREDIISRLSQLRDPVTGELVVESVYRREEIYSGPHLEEAADIVFIPRRLEYFGFGEYEFGSNKIIESMKRGISGTHRMNGIFLAWGAGIKPETAVFDAGLADLAPTILHLLGIPVPEQMDGRILHEIFHDDFEPMRNNETAVSWHRPTDQSGSGLSEEEKQIVADRLRNLGYVG